MIGQWIKLAGIVLVLMLIAIGCSSSTSQPTPTLVPTATQPPPTLTPAATVEGSFPIGKFMHVKWPIKYEFIADGRFNCQYPEVGSFDAGTYTVTGNQITIQSGLCPDVMGTYTWTYDGKTLSFTSLGDACPIREHYLVTGQYVKQP